MITVRMSITRNTILETWSVKCQGRAVIEETIFNQTLIV